MRVHSADGSPLTVHTVGDGPGIVLLHGGGLRESHYRRLAKALAAGGFAVHRYNRRGRPDTAPVTGDETIATDVEDLAAVLAATGARSAFGHSGGGFVALQAGMASQTAAMLDRIAVFDPGLYIDGRPAGGWIDEFERWVAAATTSTPSPC
ncbi:alpha/beta fold hydrolase [Catenulispora yoronensis]